MRIQVLGVCRFSLLVTGGFQKLSDDIEDRRRELYDPHRLDSRMLCFEHVFLPSIRAQTDSDFRLLVVTGEDLPEPWRGRLERLVATVPQLELVHMPLMAHGEACRIVLAERMDPRADVVAQFRLDDDDAVAVDYVRRVRSDFERFLAPAYHTQSLAGIDHCRGLALTTGGGEAEVRKVIASLWTPALTIYMPPGHAKSVFDYPHHLLFRRMPVLSLQDRFMYVRGVHDWNDSGVAARTFAEPMEPDQAREVLGRRFGIDAEGVAAALAIGQPAAVPAEAPLGQR